MKNKPRRGLSFPLLFFSSHCSLPAALCLSLTSPPIRLFFFPTFPFGWEPISLGGDLCCKDNLWDFIDVISYRTEVSYWHWISFVLGRTKPGHQIKSLFSADRGLIRNHQAYQLHSSTKNIAPQFRSLMGTTDPPGQHKEPGQTFVLGLSLAALYQHTRHFCHSEKQVLVFKWDTAIQETTWISYTLQNWLVNFLNNYVCFFFLSWTFSCLTSLIVVIITSSVNEGFGNKIVWEHYKSQVKFLNSVIAND